MEDTSYAIAPKRGLFFTARIAALIVLAAASFSGAAIYLTNGPGAILSIRYYTVQSNILICVASIAELFLLSRFGRTGAAFARVRLAAIIGIMLTGIVYSVFLSGKASSAGIQGAANFLCHFLCPLAAPAIWLAFAEKGKLRMSQAGLWLVFPLLYVAYALIQGRITGFYPYWFLNPARPRPEGIGSYAGVMGFVGIVSAAFMLLGALMVLMDGVLARKNPRKAFSS